MSMGTKIQLILDFLKFHGSPHLYISIMINVGLMSNFGVIFGVDREN